MFGQKFYVDWVSVEVLLGWSFALFFWTNKYVNALLNDTLNLTLSLAVPEVHNFKFHHPVFNNNFI